MKSVYSAAVELQWPTEQEASEAKVVFSASTVHGVVTMVALATSTCSSPVLVHRRPVVTVGAGLRLVQLTSTRWCSMHQRECRGS